MTILKEKSSEDGVVFRRPQTARKSPFPESPDAAPHKFWGTSLPTQGRSRHLYYADSRLPLAGGVTTRHTMRPATGTRGVPAVVPATLKSEERFRGKVERVADGVAYLSLVDSEGARSFASYDAVSLAASDIIDGSHFTCRVTLSGSKAELTFRPVRRERLADDDLAHLWQQIDSVMADYNPTDDD